jgi:hypothetical protein
MSNIDTIARLGEAISKTTFPKLVDEVDLSDTDSKYNNIINHFKSAIESKILRTKLTRDGSTAISIPSLCPLIMTSTEY